MQPYHSKNPLSQSLLYVAIIIGFAFLSGVLIIGLDLKGNLVPLVQGAFFLVAFIIALIIGKKKAGSLKELGYQIPKNITFLGVILPIILVVVMDIVSLIPGLKAQIDIYYILSFLLFAIIVGFTEETIFRGLIYRTLLNNHFSYALFMSSSLFGIGHLANLASGADLTKTLLQVLFAFLFGLVTVLFYARTKSLWIPIIIHLSHNFFEYIRIKQTFTEELTLGTIQSALLIIASLILWNSIKKEKTEY